MDCEETPCPESLDGQHCNCWYDGDECCYCDDAKMDEVN